MSLITLSACTPRASVLDGSVQFVVNLTHFPTMEESASREFLDSNVVTAGMEELLGNVFRRLNGEVAAAGIYLLSESMGGGKTQSLIVSGILAKYPELANLLDSSKPVGALSPDVISSFTGRETGKSFWVEIGKDLGVEFSEDHPPSETEWAAALSGKSALILLDELAFYLVGLTTEGKREEGLQKSTRASIALTGLCGAIRDHKECSRSALVISDLEKDWEQGQEDLNRILRENAALGSTIGSTTNEVGKGAHRIAPVEKDELYSILRKRLFSKIDASDSDIKELASAWVKELEKASSIIEHPIEQTRSALVDAYPFHFSTRDLIGTFNDNPGFQKTRDTIALMASIVRSLWTNSASTLDNRYLIGLGDADLNDQAVSGRFKKLKPSLNEALQTDVANDGKSHAESLDKETDSLASECARWIYVGSLAEPSALGLGSAQIAEFLIAPGRDITGYVDALKHLSDDCWYLEQKKSGRYFFNRERNLNAQVNTYAGNCGEQDREQKIEDKLQQMYQPKDKRCYQRLEIMPQLDTVKLDRNQTTLIICRDETDIERWFDGQLFKNRVAFLTPADSAGIFSVNNKARRLWAIEKVLADYTPEDALYKKAKETLTEYETELFMAVKTVWTRLAYPTIDSKEETALRTTDLLGSYTDEKTKHQIQYRPDEAAKGEFVVTATLRESSKYTSVDTTVSDPAKAYVNPKAKTERYLFPSTGKATWDQILDAAAQKGHMNWVEPNLLEHMRQALVKAGEWREISGQLQKPPFEEETSVVVEHSRDAETGVVTVTDFTLQHGNVLQVRKDHGAWETIPEDAAFQSDAMILEFKATDSTGKNKEGDLFRIENPIDIIFDFNDAATEGHRTVVIKTVPPTATLKLTTDGADPANVGSGYTSPGIEVAEGATVRVFAEKGPLSNEKQFVVPSAEVEEGGSDAPAPLDTGKPVMVSATGFKHSTRTETYDFLHSFDTDVRFQQVRAMASIAATNATVTLTWDPSSRISAERLLKGFDYLDSEVQGGEWSLKFKTLHFESGAAFQKWQIDSGTKIHSNLITQPS